MSDALFRFVATCLVLGVLFTQVVRAGEEAVPKPPELRVLDRLVGSWNAESISRPAEWTPKEMRTTGVLSREWVLGGRFVQERASHPDKVEAMVMFGFDARKKTYVAWRFTSSGEASDMPMQWDEATQTFSSRSDLGNGLTSTVSIHFIDNDTHEWKAVVRDGAGKVYLDAGGKCTRRK